MFSKVRVAVSFCREDERMSTLDDDEGEQTDKREGGELEAGLAQEEVPRINVEIPRCVANLGSELHFVKLPNFLSVETRCSSILSRRNRCF